MLWCLVPLARGNKDPVTCGCGTGATWPGNRGTGRMMVAAPRLSSCCWPIIKRRGERWRVLDFNLFCWAHLSWSATKPPRFECDCRGAGPHLARLLRRIRRGRAGFGEFTEACVVARCSSYVLSAGGRSTSEDLALLEWARVREVEPPPRHSVAHVQHGRAVGPLIAVGLAYMVTIAVDRHVPIE